MGKIIELTNVGQDLLDKFKVADFLAPLLLRIYLVPIFWMAGTKKWNPFDPESSLDSVINWFGNPDWGLGLPFPALMAYLAWASEYFGAICLAIGLAVRWISIPLMMTMIVAAATVHWQNGWLAVAEGSGLFATERTVGAIEHLDRAKSILKEHANYERLTENGNFVVLNNGIEFAATYFLMLLALFFIGGGKYFSIDFWIYSQYRRIKPNW